MRSYYSRRSLMERSFSQVSDLLTNVMDFVRTPVAHGLISGIILSGTFGAISYHVQKEKPDPYKLAFSEIGGIMKRFKADGLPTPPLTAYYGKKTDFNMQVFEAADIALQTNRDNKTFADELEYKVDPAWKIHPRQMPVLAKMLEDDSKAALNSVSKLTDARSQMPNISDEFSKVWSESHYEESHTEITPGTCDSKGNCTSPTTRTVCDYVVYDYTYHRNHGMRASEMVDAFIAAHPDLKTAEKLVPALTTGADNEEAIETSMKDIFKGRIPTQAEYLAKANTFVTGSNLTNYQGMADYGYDQLKQSAISWDRAKNTARSVTRTVGCTFPDDGPPEYQLATALQSTADGISTASGKIVDPMYSTVVDTSAILKLARQFIDAANDPSKSRQATQLREELLDRTQDLYRKDFEKGFNEEPVNPNAVLILAAIGMALGGAGGYGASRGVEALLRRRSSHGRYSC